MLAHISVERENTEEVTLVWEQSGNDSLKKKKKVKPKLSFEKEEKKKKDRMSQACGRLCQAEGTARTKAWRLENITPHTQRDEQGEEVRGRAAVSNVVPEF